MDFSKFFIDRPIFAAVLSIIIFVAGLIAIPIAAYQRIPERGTTGGHRARDLSRRQPQSDRRNRIDAA